MHIKVWNLISAFFLASLLPFTVYSQDSGISEENVIDVAAPSPSPNQQPSVKSDSLDSATLTDTMPAIEKMPEIIKFVKADYPPDLIKQGIQGDVILDLVISDSGKVDSVAVVKGLSPVLDTNAARVAKQFLFTPAIADSQPVPVILQYAYHYTLDEVVSRIDTFVNFKGKLLERGTRAPLPDALVALTFPDTTSDTSLKVPFSDYLAKIGTFKGQSLQGVALTTTTDSLGKFEFKSLPSCRIKVKVVIPDYEALEETEVLRYSEQTDVVYRLQRISYGDNEIVVYGKVETKEVAKRTLTLNEIRKIPGLGGDAVKVVQALPGVARSAFGMGAIIVRGSGSGDTRYLLDGVEIPLLFHFGGLKSTYNSDALSAVDLYPGGFGTRYGGATGGIIEITGRKSKTDRYHGYLDGNLFDASFLVEGPITKNISFLATARRSYIANVLAFATEKVLKTVLMFTAVPFYWDYVLRTDVDITKEQHAYVTLFGSKDRMDLIMNQVRGGSADIDSQTNRLTSEQFFHLGIAGWDWSIGPLFKNSFRYSPSYLVANASAFGFFKVKSDGWEHYVRDQFSWIPNENLTFNAGIDARIYPYHLVLIIPSGTNEIIKDTTDYLFGPWGAYVSAEWKPWPGVTLIPGLRYDYYPELTYDGSIIPEFWDYQDYQNLRGISGEPSVRLTAKYNYMKNHTAKGSVGNYSQGPRPEGQAIHPKWGNPKLPAEKGSQYVLGYEWQLTDLISADLQVYHNQQWDNARQASAKDMLRNPQVMYYGDGKAKMNGLELMLKHEQSKHFFGWISYTLSRSERFNYDENRWAIFSQDQTNILLLIASFKFAGNRELGTRIRYVTGNPTTPVLGIKHYDATFQYYMPKYGPVNSGRMDPFFSVDLRYERKFAFKNFMFDVYLDITNLSNLFGYGYRSPEIGQYMWNYDYTDKQVISDITRPAVGIKFEF